jgi:PAS domain-containing protein
MWPTGEKKNLESLGAAKDRVTAELAALAKLTIDKQALQSRLAPLREAVQGRMSSIETVLETHGSKGLAEAKAHLAGDGLRKETEAIGDQLDIMTREEKFSLKKQDTASTAGRQELTITVITSSSLTLAVFGLLFWMTLREARARRRMERDLTLNEDMRVRLVEASQDCVCTLDTSGRIISMNQEGQRRMEVERFGKLVNFPWLDLWPGDSAPLARQALGQARLGNVGAVSGDGADSERAAKMVGRGDHADSRKQRRD